jgi:hypothetical protein
MIKKIIIKILQIIRRFLTALKKHCLPKPTIHDLPYERYTKEQREKSFDYFKTYFLTSIFLDTHNIYEYIIEKAKENDKEEQKLYLEFGVYKGHSINLFSKSLKKIYGFDSFEGLREDWIGYLHPKGTFNLNKKVPKLNRNVSINIGWVQDTLIPFLDKNKEEINFVHMDMDTYESTKYVLKNIKSRLAKKCIILFDELYNFPGFEVNEYKALKEIFNENEYKYILFSKDGTQAAIQII